MQLEGCQYRKASNLYFFKFMGKRPDNAFGVFINHFIKAYRSYEEDKFTLTISGLGKFISDSDCVLETLLERLYENNILVKYTDDKESIDLVDVHYKNESNGESGEFAYNVHSLPLIDELSARTNLSTSCIMIMHIVAKLVCKRKTLFKAVVLDLDDTLWNGTLREDGIEAISHNMRSPLGKPYISFMKFIRRLAEDLGIFVAVCSKNEVEDVSAAIDYLGDDLFPLKNQIDCLVANDNSKSNNLSLIIEQLSVLPGSVVFIDDNLVIRDEIREHCPDVFVPEWDNHFELMTALIGGCIFERNELSISSQNRRKNFRIIQAVKQNNVLPKLLVKVIDDNEHREANKLYSKSNQFRFTRNPEQFPGECKSTYFEIYRESGERLDVCTVLTYSYSDNIIHVWNWAMSCRYFEIGLEELVLLYLTKLADGRRIQIDYVDTGKNKKVNALIGKYPQAFSSNDDSASMSLIISEDFLKQLKENTNLVLD